MADLLPSLPSDLSVSSFHHTGVLKQTVTRGSLRPTYVRAKNVPRRLEPLQAAPKDVEPSKPDLSPKKQAKAFIGDVLQESSLYKKAAENLAERVAAGESQAAVVLGKLHFEMVR